VLGEVGGLGAKTVEHRQARLARAAHLDRKVAIMELQVRCDRVRQVARDIRPLVHQVHLGQDADRPLSQWVMLARQLDRGVGLEIGTGGTDHEDNGALLRDVGGDHLTDLRLDVLGLALCCQRRHRQPWQIYEREVWYVRREQPQVDRFGAHAFLTPGVRFGLRFDVATDARQLRGGRVGIRQCDLLLANPHALNEGTKLCAHFRRLRNVDQLQRKRRASHHLLTEWQDVSAH